MPVAGLITLSSPGAFTTFGGSFIPVTVAEVIAALKNLTARNYLWSRKWAADGKENNAAVSFSPTDRSSTYSGSSSISPSFSFSVATTPALALPCLRTRNLTFVDYNIAGPGFSSSHSLTVNGASASMGTVSNIADGAASSLSYEGLIQKSLQSVATINPTFGKGTGEAFNSQVMHLLPGLWTRIDNGSLNETSGFSGAGKTFTVQTNDLIFIVVSQGTAAPTSSPASNFTLIMNRNTGNNEYVYSIDAAGTFDVNPSTFNVGSFLFNHAFFAIQYRFIQA